MIKTIKPAHMQIVKSQESYEDAIRLAAKPLLDDSYITEQYIEDMQVAQEFAEVNRYTIMTNILDYLRKTYGNISVHSFDTVHNYIGEDRIIRKGAISAYKAEDVIIPINMKDGVIHAIGKENEDSNNSAPHGAGRILGRRQAKKILNVKDFENDMSDIFTTSVNDFTLDESPRVYKTLKEIVDNTKDTIEILHIVKPIYNFKDRGDK